MKKKWQVARPISEETKAQFPEIHPVVLQLLHNRGFTSQAQIDEFLRSDWSHDVHDPFLFRDMHQAVNRIFKAVENKEKIAIWGDYDADGVCGTAILFNTLKRIGFEQIELYIPHRETEGYGLNKAGLDKIIKQSINLMVTVDLGIAEAENIKYSQSRGLDVIVVDHHDLKEELPPAVALVHNRVPGDKYPYKHLSGGGTAFKLAQALLDQTLEEHEAFEKWLLDLVAISTVADMVPLTGENRTLVRYGMLVLNKTQRLGLRELIYVAGLSNGQDSLSPLGKGSKLSAWNLAFQIAPRINAAGRISHAQEALELLLTDSETEAKVLAKHLNSKNKERQKLADQVLKEALEQLGDFKEEDYLLFAYNPAWPLGIVGLVAGKLADQFHRPVFLTTETEGRVKGSARSIPEFNVKEALDTVSGYLATYGGHEGAAGFTLREGEQENFVKALKEFAQKKLKSEDLLPAINIDAEVYFKDVNWELTELIEEFEPFGQDNPIPIFISKKVKVKGIDAVGNNGRHLKLRVCDEHEENTYKVIGFGLAEEWQPELKINGKIDIVYELGFNEWNGRRELQIKLKDLRKSFS